MPSLVIRSSVGALKLVCVHVCIFLHRSSTNGISPPQGRFIIGFSSVKANLSGRAPNRARSMVPLPLNALWFEYMHNAFATLISVI
jgi:hypothetical protein